MEIDDIQKVIECTSPETLIMATHLDSGNHALLTRRDIKKRVEYADNVLYLA